MDLRAYLTRVGFAGEPRPDLETLRRLHRAHVENIPFENLDVALGRAVSRDPAAIFDKLVRRGRGGWCYEMNGLFAAVLETIGFDVVRMAGGVMRATLGDTALGNHLVLAAQLDRRYLVDVGFGNGLAEPMPVVDGSGTQGPLTFRIEDLGAGWWRFHDDPRSGSSFDFELQRGDERLLDQRCAWLQSNAESPFVLNATVQRRFADKHAALRGRRLTWTYADRVETRDVVDADDYARTLEREFGLNFPEARALWSKVEARHRQLFPG